MTVTSLAQILDIINQAIDWFLLGVLFVGVVVYNIYTLIKSASKEIEKESKRAKQEATDAAMARGESLPSAYDPLQNPTVWVIGIGKALYLWIITAAIQLGVFLVFWYTSDFSWPKPENVLISAENLRWGELYLGLGFGAYFQTRKFGGKRGLVTMLGHLTTLLIGWLLGRWLGIFFVSLPILGVFYYLIYRFAEVILPASDPESQPEKWQRFKILAWYLWGSQFPIIIVDDQTGMKVETRIKGDIFQDFFGVPGFIWTHMPQAIGLSNGTNFSRVEGPGAIYTKPFERPLDVIDLRTQLRTTEVEAITQDGIPLKAIVFASFCIDRTPWDRAVYNRLKLANPMLRGGRQLDHGNSHFQYSRPRVRAALSMEGVKTSISGPVGSVSWRWDEQVMILVAETARRVISEIPLSELWQPNAEKDEEGKSALDLIATEISQRLTGELQEQGVHLFAARIVNYFSLKDDAAKDKFGEFTQQQIPAWRARWEQQVRQKLAEAEAYAEQKQVDATSLARSLLLTSIAESLQKSTATNKDLPRYLIAMRFLGALNDMLHQNPELLTGEAGKILRERIEMDRKPPSLKA